MRQEGKKRSAAMIFLSAVSETAMPFVRSVALAHLIAPDQFGIAITLALAAGMLELFTDIGIGNSAMRQGRHGEDQDVLPTLHTILLARAVLIGLVLAGSGPLLAFLFGVPDAALSFSMLGLAAFIRGFHHLEPTRVLKDFIYGPDAVTTAIGHAVWSGVTIAVAFVLDDYRCMLVGIIVGAIAYVVATHLASRERWRLGWSREVAREALLYGAPLIPNGVALAVSSMSDRFLIGSFLGVTPLAYYNASATTAFMPRGVVLRLLSAVTLPTFLRYGREGVVSSRIADYYGLLLSAIGAFYSLAFLCFGPFAIGLVFGAQYAPSQILVSCIALSVYMKYMMTLPQPPALAFGQTKLVLMSTVLASLGLVSAGIAVLVSPHLPSFVFGYAVGEFATVIWCVVVSIRIYRFDAKLSWFGALFPLAPLAASHLLCASVASGDLPSRIGIALGASLVLIAGYAAAWKFFGLPWIPEFARLLKAGAGHAAPPVQSPEEAV